jgi:hypothetical protein
MSLIRINRNPSGRDLLVFGAAWLALLAGAGASCWRKGHPEAATLLWVLAAAVPLAGALERSLIRHVFVGLSVLTYPVGLAVSQVALALVYFGFVTPLGLTMRLFGHDPLQRKPDLKCPTFWRERGPPGDPESYFRQD